MKKNLSLLVIAMSLMCSPVFSQSEVDTTNKLGLAGDNLDLYAVLTLFQKSKTIEAFEKSLNDEQTKINNLDLNLDKKVDFIKVTTKKEDSAFTFILQVDVTKTETQDVAIILVNKENGKISIQAVGDPELYGKDYVIEPKGNSSVTPNPGYKGADPVTVTVEATPTTVVVQQAPIVQYVYSPAYVPYYPPYYYGYYPGWFAVSAVVTWGIYAGFHNHYHGGYYGGHYGGGNTVIVNNGNRNQINHYNNSRNTSNTVRNNKAQGGYGDGRGSTGVNNNMRGSNTNRGSTGVNNNMSNNRGSTGNRASTGASNNMSNNRGSTSTRPSTSNMSSSRSSSTNSGRTMSSGGGGRSMGGGGGGGRRR